RRRMDECGEPVVGLPEPILNLLLQGNVDQDAKDLLRGAVRMLLKHGVVEEPAIGPIGDSPSIFGTHGACIGDSLKCKQDLLTIGWMETRSPEVRILQEGGAGESGDHVDIVAHPKCPEIP